MQYCPMANYHYVHNLDGKVFGGNPKIFMFWLFYENGSISEQTVNRALTLKRLGGGGGGRNLPPLDVLNPCCCCDVLDT